MSRAASLEREGGTAAALAPALTHPAHRQPSGEAEVARLATASAALPKLDSKAYEPGVVDLLFGLLCDVARRRQPEVELALRGQSLPDTVPRAVWRRSLQAQGGCVPWGRILRCWKLEQQQQRHRFLPMTMRTS